ncbi:Sel1 domain-containing protein [Neoasaia chiangmaiensis NBRC 101099]|nr:tetratricopeptide repeat protein [Neoasaia chiangmaiensis]GBR35710.1 Sel1 domain-containing protein [Neoasaia chiangmaiensis NBRC 101099]
MKKFILPLFGSPEEKLKHAQNLLKNGKSRRGIKQLYGLAIAGNAEAQFMLGELYLADKDVPMNGNEALRWFRQAAEQHHVKACHRLGVLSHMGFSVPAGEQVKVFDMALKQGKPDHAEALSWAERAVEGGDFDGMVLAAHLLTQGPETLRDIARGHELYQRAAEGGNVQGLYGHGVTLLGAARTSGERSRAVAFIQQAATGGLPDAELMLGTILEYEGGKDAQAFSHFMKAATQSHSVAQMKVGVAYYQGRGIERDVSKAETWLRKAAQGGEVEAIALVGDINLQGDGVAPNFPEAHSWYRRAVKSGHVGAAVTLAQLFYNGMGCETDHAEAKRLLDFAADHGSEQAVKLRQILESRPTQSSS